MIRLWIDDIRPAPKNYTWLKSVKGAETLLLYYKLNEIDDIKLLNWLEAEDMVDERFTFHIHSMNPVGVQNMRAIIQKNGWREV